MKEFFLALGATSAFFCLIKLGHISDVMDRIEAKLNQKAP